MSFLFTPPQRTNIVMMEGSLRCSFPVSWTAYKQAGVWTAVECPSEDVLVAADNYLPGTPSVVDDTLGAELVAALPALNAALPADIASATCVAV